MSDISNCIITWCNNAEPENMTLTNDATQIAFNIQVLNEEVGV